MNLSSRPFMTTLILNSTHLEIIETLLDIKNNTTNTLQCYKIVRMLDQRMWKLVCITFSSIQFENRSTGTDPKLDDRQKYNTHH